MSIPFDTNHTTIQVNALYPIRPFSLQDQKEEGLLQGIVERFNALSNSSATSDDINDFIKNAQVILNQKLSQRMTYYCNLYLALTYFFHHQKMDTAARYANAAFKKNPRIDPTPFKILAAVSACHLRDKEYNKAIKVATPLLHYTPQMRAYLHQIYSVITHALTCLSKHADAIGAAFAMAITSNDTQELNRAFNQNQQIFENLRENQEYEKAFLPYLALFCSVRSKDQKEYIEDNFREFYTSSIPRTKTESLGLIGQKFVDKSNEVIKNYNSEQRNPAFDLLLPLLETLQEHKHFEDLTKMLIPLAHLTESDEEVEKLYAISNQVFSALSENREYSMAVSPLRAMLILSQEKEEYQIEASNKVFDLAPKLIANKNYAEIYGLIFSAFSIPLLSTPLQAALKIHRLRIQTLETAHTLGEMRELRDAQQKEQESSTFSQPPFHNKPDIDAEPRSKRTPPKEEDSSSNNSVSTC